MAFEEEATVRRINTTLERQRLRCTLKSDNDNRAGDDTDIAIERVSPISIGSFADGVLQIAKRKLTNTVHAAQLCLVP